MWVAEKDASLVMPGIRGAIAAINCSTTPQVIDLTSFPNPGIKTADPSSQNPIGHFIRIVADGGNVYYSSGNNFALLNGIPNTNITSAVNATTGKVTIGGNEMDMIPSGGWADFFVPAAGTPQAQNPPGALSPCRFVALAASTGNVTARIHQSGP